MKYLTKDLALTINNLRTSYTPYDGLPPIEVILSPEPDKVCDWLGLDHARWLQGFKDEEELYLWMATGKDGSLIAMAHQKMGREKHDSKHCGSKKETKLPGWYLFIEWLRESDTSPWKAPPGVSATPIPTTAEANNLIDPDHPNTLDPLAKAAITTWGKWGEFERQMRDRAALAAVRAQQQKKRNKPALTLQATSSSVSTITRKLSSLSLSSRTQASTML